MIPVGTTQVSALDTYICPITFHYKMLCRALNMHLLFVHDGSTFHLNITFQLYKCFEALWFSFGSFGVSFYFLLLNLSLFLFFFTWDTINILKRRSGHTALHTVPRPVPRASGGTPGLRA